MSSVLDPRALERLEPGLLFPRMRPNERRLTDKLRVRFSVLWGGQPGYLDGNQYSSGVDIVHDAALAGVNWTLHAKPNGSWQIRNQDDMAHGLTAERGSVHLAPLNPDFKNTDPVADWLIYRCGREGHVRLRPAGGVWLVADETRGLRFDAATETDPDLGLWHLTTDPILPDLAAEAARLARRSRLRRVKTFVRSLGTARANRSP